MMKKLLKLTAFAATALTFTSCPPETATDYQAYMSAGLSKAVFVINADAESLSAVDPAGQKVYNHIQLVGYSGSNTAIPSDLIVNWDYIHVLLSGQNSIETYDKLTLDYIDAGRHYFKNGYNPIAFIPVPGTSWVFCPGFGTDQVQPVNLASPSTDYSFADSWTAVDLSGAANTESTVAATALNAVGDNKKRGSSSGAVFVNGADSRLYVGNVRYDASIRLTEADGSLAEYPAGSGNEVRAPGYFRQATVSVFGFDANAMTDGASDAALNFRLIKEINLEDLYRSAAGAVDYFPGDGLNPQSVFMLDGLLNIVCTGTNGGSARTFSDAEYIPDGFSAGGVKPGTDPDDGVIIILDPSADPDNPAYVTSLDIGGSPCGYRESVDTGRKIVYLAGVGGIQSYIYGSSTAGFSVEHSSSELLLAADTPESDFYSGLAFDSADDVLYISFYSDDSMKTLNVSGGSASAAYSEGPSYSLGDGPGAVSILEF